jgi:glycine/D-amino acid oxidase-like deaminating enzyme
MKFDTVVLGAGIVGVCVAVHLQKRGRQVALVDRKLPGNETSFGNAGLIQREGVYPYAFPRALGTLLRYARNQSPDVRSMPTRFSKPRRSCGGTGAIRIRQNTRRSRGLIRR